MRLLYALPVHVPSRLDQVMYMDAEDPDRLYDAKLPYRDLGVTKTGLERKPGGPGMIILRTSVAELHESRIRDLMSGSFTFVALWQHPDKTIGGQSWRHCTVDPVATSEAMANGYGMGECYSMPLIIHAESRGTMMGEN